MIKTAHRSLRALVADIGFSASPLKVRLKKHVHISFELIQISPPFIKTTSPILAVHSISKLYMIFIKDHTNKRIKIKLIVVECNKFNLTVAIFSL